MLRLTSIVRLGQDATVNTVNNKKVINFTAAYSEKYRNQEGVEVNNTVWISCAYWTEKLNLANYLRKGVQILIEGKPEAKIYTNKQGQSIPQLTVRVSNIQLLGSSNNQNNQQTQSELVTNNSEELMISDDSVELPF